MDNKGQDLELFAGFNALSDNACPKEYATCGCVYRSPEDVVQQSQDINGHSGLKHGYGEDDRPVVEWFRNCLCGYTLMDSFQAGWTPLPPARADGRWSGKWLRTGKVGELTGKQPDTYYPNRCAAMPAKSSKKWHQAPGASL